MKLENMGDITKALKELDERTGKLEQAPSLQKEDLKGIETHSRDIASRVTALERDMDILKAPKEKKKKEIKI